MAFGYSHRKQIKIFTILNDFNPVTIPYCFVCFAFLKSSCRIDYWGNMDPWCLNSAIELEHKGKLKNENQMIIFWLQLSTLFAV